MSTVKLDPAKGIQLPNKTTSERNAISSPETGAILWNTTTSTVDKWNGSAWSQVDTNADITGLLPKSGGAMTGAITTNSTFDGRDVAADGVLATNALPKAGGTLTGNLIVSGARAEIQTANNSATHLVQRLGSTAGTYGYVDFEVVNPSSTATNLPRFDMQIGNTNVLSLCRGGNVGIGATSPAAAYGSDTVLEISGSTSPGLVINDTGQGSKYGIHADSNDLKITYGAGTLAAFQNDGNVGIGTSSPASGRGIQGAVLHISDTPDAALRITDTGGSDFEISAETNTTMGTIDNTALNIITNNTNRMTIGNDGRVSIAQTGNATALVVSTSVAAETTAIIQGGGTGNVDVLDIRDSSGNTKFKVRQNGNVGIGVVPKAWNAALTGLQIGETGAISGGNTAWGGYLEIGSNFYRDSGGFKYTTADKACLTEYDNSAGDINFKTSNGSAGSAGGGIAWINQLQIKHNGEVLKGPFHATGGNTGTKFINGEIHTSYNGAAPRKQIYIYNPNGEVGSIASSFTSCNFNTSSDYRLKENVDYTWDATTKLKQLKPARFNFIAHPERTVDGFLAHEAGTVVPECVTGTHNEVDGDGNAVMQGIDQSKLVPLLVKTIQELEARITALEA